LEATSVVQVTVAVVEPGVAVMAEITGGGLESGVVLNTVSTQ
jgi:hypothetical protein